MSNQDNAAQSSAPAASVDVKMLQSMLQILLEEKADQAKERNEKKRQHEARQASHKSLSVYNEKEAQDSQRLCTHLKGGKLKGARMDYAVGHHTFPDGATYIRCLICRMKWKKNDTRDHLIRRGQKITNHTGLSWLDAVNMLKSSTNTPTSSETVTTVKIVDTDAVQE